MSHHSTPSLLTLPIEPVCRILDHLDPVDILLSVRNVCSRLDAITDTYHPYTVNTTIVLVETPYNLISPRVPQRSRARA